MNPKQIVIILLTVTLFTACKNESKEKETPKTQNMSVEFNKMLDNYYEQGLALNPLNATFSGDNRFNNSFPNFLSEEYNLQLENYYKTYKEEASKFEEGSL